MASHQEEFTLEEQLYYCMRHLEIKLQTKNINPKEAKTLMQSLKMLGNEKTPLIKKRQIMRVTCGDYRAAMQEETKKLKKQMKKMKIASIKKNKKSRFLKKSVPMDYKDEIENAKASVTEKKASVFLFNFPEMKDDVKSDAMGHKEEKMKIAKTDLLQSAKELKKMKIKSMKNTKGSRFLQKSLAMDRKDEMANAKTEEKASVFLFNFPEIKDDVKSDVMGHTDEMENAKAEEKTSELFKVPEIKDDMTK